MLDLFRFLYYSFLFLIGNFSVRNKKCFTNSSIIDGKLVVLISPWNNSATPYFFIKLGSLLKYRGNNVVFVLDDIRFDFNYFLNVVVLKFVLSILNIEYFVISRFEDSKNLLDLSDYRLFDDVIDENVLAKFKGDVNSDLSIEFKKQFSFQLFKSHLKIVRLLELYSDYHFVIPGGSFGTSGLLVRLGEKFNVSFVTIDSGFGLISICQGGIAAKNQFINSLTVSSLFNKYNNGSCLNDALLHVKQRMSPTFELSLQSTSAKGVHDIGKDYFVLFLNIVWDSAAFVKNYNHQGYLESIRDFVFKFINNSNQILIIRQHPDERKWWGKSFFILEDFFSEFSEYFGSRLILYSSSYQVNSYDLVNSSKGVFLWSSTIGLESILLGKPTFYLSLNYVSRCDELSHFIYHDEGQLLNFINYTDNFKVTDRDKLYASLVFLITQKLSWHPTLFTPQTADFLKWVKFSTDYFQDNEMISDCLASVELKMSLTDYHIKNRY
jgi:hypothetical protein